VRNHLLFSVTAQKKDISDPTVIRDFARTVGDQAHLDYLYLLTVADLRGTNPKLWNSWKSSLFHDFYERTRRALRRGLESPVDHEELAAETRAAAAELLARDGLEPGGVDEIWSRMTEGYFLRHTPSEIAWHTRLLADRDPADASPLVAVRESTERGGNAVLTYMPHRRHNFARTTALLDQMGLNILDARITALDRGLSIETYLVLEDTGAPIADRHRAHEIEQQLWRVLQLPEDATPPAVTRRAPRQVRMFTTPTQIGFSEDPLRQHTILELIAGDRPGLLSEVGKVLLAERVDVITARILTIGERAEDVFHVTDDLGRPLGEELRTRLQQRLVEALDRRESAGVA
jgi:[protein-PII] uridylyltransferase